MLLRYAVALRRAVGRHRVLLSAGLAAGSVAAGLTAAAPPPPPRTGVVVATADLDAGRPLTPADTTTGWLPPEAVPDGAVPPGTPLTGRLLAGPVRRGEPLTDVRLVGPALLDALGARVAVPVRVADAATTGLVRPGDRVDVLAAGTVPDDAARAGAAPAVVVADGVTVLAVPASTETGDGALLVVATTPAVAGRLAAAAVTSRLSLTLRGPP